MKYVNPGIKSLKTGLLFAVGSEHKAGISHDWYVHSLACGSAISRGTHTQQGNPI